MILTRRQALLDICTAGGVLFSGGCAINPVTGKPQLMLMSERREIELGSQTHPEILASYGVYSDEKVQKWFNARGQEMARVSQRSNLSFTFTVLDSPVVNAFAVPGGYVYITRGILGYFNDEAQFAGVLGHELGHVAARHSARQYSKAQLTNLAIGIGSVFSEEFARFSDFASLGASFMFLKFSRDDEREADKLGVEYSSNVGYDATRMSDFFGTLERMSPSKGSLPEWASTHPDPGDRITATRRMALNFQKANPDRKFRVNRNEYLDVVDGIVYGDDPRQGYEKNGMFYHPGLKFQFPVPAEWSITNQPSEVRVAPKSGNGVLLFRIEQGSNPQDAGTKFAASNKITLSDSRSFPVNGLNGYAMLGQMSSDGQTQVVKSHFIQMDDKVFAFHGVSTVDEYRTYESAFSQMATGFNRINNQSVIDVSPKKIEVRTVSKSRNLRSAFQNFNVPEKEIDELAIINGMELGDQLAPGIRIKIIG